MPPTMPTVGEVTKTMLYTGAFVLGVWIVFVGTAAWLEWKDRAFKLRIMGPRKDKEVEAWKISFPGRQDHV